MDASSVRCVLLLFHGLICAWLPLLCSDCATAVPRQYGAQGQLWYCLRVALRVARDQRQDETTIGIHPSNSLAYLLVNLILSKKQLESI